MERRARTLGKDFSALVAGGGFKGGHVVGASDAKGEEVRNVRVSGGPHRQHVRVAPALTAMRSCRTGGTRSARPAHDGRRGEVRRTAEGNHVRGT